MNQPKPYNQNKVDRSTVISLEKGKIPPQAVDLEEVVLGAMMIDKQGVYEAIETISDNEDVFYKDAHKYIYTAIFDLFADDSPIDLLTVSDQLKSKAQLDLVGGDFYLIGLTQRVSSSAHTERHCRILMQKYVQRQSIKVASVILEEAYDETKDIFDLLEESQKALDDTSEWLLRKKAENLSSVFDKLIENSKNPQASIPSKFTKLNKRTNGYHPNDLVIIAARPGMGKTAFVLNEAKFQSEQGIPVGFLSLEMSDVELVGRIIANEFGIESSRIKQNQLTPSEKEVIRKESEKIKKLPIHIHDGSETTVNEAKTIIGKWVRQEKVRIVYVDYLQLMRGSTNNKNGNREQEIAQISRKLKAIAKEFQIPVVALSQLSRAVETRGGMKRPQLSDLRESGAIEQDANVVQFLLRPEYYKIDEWDVDMRTPTAGQCELNTAKTREGSLGATVLDSSELKYMRFKDLKDFDDSWKDNEFKPEPLSPDQAFEPRNHVDNENYDDDLPF
ncbi:replicative DNA helicase [Winogradskyella forsetii]|uniref:replicative DNA helicase n=1 Tax=Winogradskyella forsetii TaxID=2686077 RepID=UPI0015BE0925|nr:replicative DNA helicase [Winogradskyella forsetii]